MADEGEDDVDASVQGIEPAELGGWARTWCAVLGLAASGAGGVAIFTEDLEAGPVALLAFGFIFLLLAIIGRIPTSAKMGGASLAWTGHVGRLLAKAADEAPAEVREEIAQELTDSVDIPSSVSRPTVRSTLYKGIVAGVLDAAVRDLAKDGIEFEVRNEVRFSNLPGQRFDYLLVRPDGGNVVVEVRRSLQTLQGLAFPDAQLEDQIKSWFSYVPNLVGAIVIFDNISPEVALKLQLSSPKSGALEIVKVQSDQDRRILRGALRTMSELPILNNLG